MFIPRHGSHHELLPSEVNYRANIWALKKAGATKVLSMSAVGSLRQNLKPGDVVVIKQYLDRTKGIRKHTFCGDGVVGHVSLAHPVSLELTSILRERVQNYPFTCHFDVTYVCVEGPYFSTQAESKQFIAAGADVIGMTNFPEYALAREAGLAYLPCGFVTDYDSWDDQRAPVELAAVFEVMRENRNKAFSLAKDLISQTETLDVSRAKEQGLHTGLMTPIETISTVKREWLDVLRS